MEIINLKEKTLDQLKVMAYDIMVAGEQIQRNLQAINSEIAQRMREELAEDNKTM